MKAFDLIIEATANEMVGEEKCTREYDGYNLRIAEEKAKTYKFL